MLTSLTLKMIPEKLIGKPYLPIPSPLTRGIPQKARLEGKFARFQRILSPKMAQFARFRYIARQWEIQG